MRTRMEQLESQRASREKGTGRPPGQPGRITIKEE